MTLDCINLDYFNNLSRLLLSGKFKFAPGRRVFVKKFTPGKLRPITIDLPPSRKIVQKSLQLVLDAIFDSSFSDSSSEKPILSHEATSNL